MPGFEGWYALWQEKMKLDPIMKWSVTARNQIEKQGDLQTKSSVTAEIIASYIKDENPTQKVEARVCDTLDEIIARIPPRVLQEQVLKHGTIKIERCWVEANLPDVEVLEAIAHVHGFLSTILEDAHSAFGLSEFDQIELTHDGISEVIHNERNHIDGKFPCMVATSEYRSMQISLSNGQARNFGTVKKHVSREDMEIAKKRYYGDRPIEDNEKPSWNVEDMAENLFNMARTVFIKDGYHSNVALLIHPTKGILPMQLETEVRADKYLIMKKVADEVERHGSDIVVLINEAWTAPFDPENPYQYPAERADKKEMLLLVAAGKDGTNVNMSAEIIRNGNVATLATTQKHCNEGVTNILQPIIDLWKRQGKISSGE
ncbi:hypothetical protein [Terasakiella brassicae]|uniref:hypothetical protein n=1 Tax=Terasakiella brassicae TaxID=1634917 RepID=UPI00166838DD|nr:hypothetical protein [Terasakiella brassicae]